MFDRTRADGVRPGGCATLSRVHGGSAAAGHSHRADAEAGPVSESAAVGGAAVAAGAQLHVVIRGEERGPGAVSLRGMDRSSARSYRMPFRHTGRSFAPARGPEPHSLLLR